MTEERALEILQAKYGTQVTDVMRITGTNRYTINKSGRAIFVNGKLKNIFTLGEILGYEDEMCAVNQ